MSHWTIDIKMMGRPIHSFGILEKQAFCDIYPRVFRSLYLVEVKQNNSGNA